MTNEQQHRAEAAKEQVRKSKAAGTAFLDRLKAGDMDAINSDLRHHLFTRKGTLRKYPNEGWTSLLMMMKAGTTFDEAFAKIYLTKN
tara:strand:- start:258 stop:518 length:261 start_codon:yes stop_codon:yes gene_type:complete